MTMPPPLLQLQPTDGDATVISQSTLTPDLNEWIARMRGPFNDVHCPVLRMLGRQPPRVEWILSGARELRVYFGQMIFLTAPMTRIGDSGTWTLFAGYKPTSLTTELRLLLIEWINTFILKQSKTSNIHKTNKLARRMQRVKKPRTKVSNI